LQIAKVAVLEDYVAAVWLDQPEDQASGGRLTAARLADDANGCTATHVERDVIDGGYGCFLEHAGADRELLAEAHDLQQRSLERAFVLLF
jgi:hypothetical protein